MNYFSYDIIDNYDDLYLYDDNRYLKLFSK